MISTSYFIHKGGINNTCQTHILLFNNIYHSMGFPVKQRMASVADPTNINSNYLLHHHRNHEAAVTIGQSLLGRPTPTIIDNNNRTTNSMNGLDILCIAADTKSKSSVTRQVLVSSSSSIVSNNSKEGPLLQPSTPPLPDDNIFEQNNTISSSPTVPKPLVAKVSGSKWTHKQRFPNALLDMLSNPEFASIVSWIPNGRAFAIHDESKFTSLILPKYFPRITVFRSFIRQLNRWQFRSVRGLGLGDQEAKYVFEHDNFCRDDPSLLPLMVCKSRPRWTKALNEIDSLIVKRENEKLLDRDVGGVTVPPQAQVPQATATVQDVPSRNSIRTRPLTPPHPPPVPQAVQDVLRSSIRFGAVEDNATPRGVRDDVPFRSSIHDTTPRVVRDASLMSNIELSHQLDILRELQRRKFQQHQRTLHMLMILQEQEQHHQQQQYRQGRGGI